MEGKNTLWRINWGDGDNFYVVASSEKAAIEGMPDGKDMVNFVVKLDHLYQEILKAGIKEVVEDMARTLETAPHHKTIASMWQCLQKWQAKLKE